MIHDWLTDWLVPKLICPLLTKDQTSETTVRNIISLFEFLHPAAAHLFLSFYIPFNLINLINLRSSLNSHALLITMSGFYNFSYFINPFLTIRSFSRHYVICPTKRGKHHLSYPSFFLIVLNIICPTCDLS